MTIALPDDVHARLQGEARQHAVSVSDIVRRSIVAYLGPPDEDRESQPQVGHRLSFEAIGVGPDDRGSEHVDELWGQALTRRTGLR